MGLTKRQAEILAKLWKFEQETHISPSVAEVRQMMKIKSNQSVLDMFARLEKDGWIKRQKGKARSLSLTPQARQYLMGLGAYSIENHYLDVKHYKIKMTPGEKADSTHNNNLGVVGNASITYQTGPKLPEPQQLSLLNYLAKEAESTGTKNSKNDKPYNTMTVQWVSNILNATSTSAIVHAKEFVGDFFQSGFLYFIALKKLTGFSFPEIVVIVAFCLTSVFLLKNQRREEHVFSH